MPRRARPFDEMIDRSGEHHLWTGAHKADGTGQVRVNGKLYAAPHVAWERENGPVPDGFRVKKCSVPACVRVEHLALVPARRTSANPRPRSRGVKGGGTRNEIRPGVWKVTASAGRYDDGSQRREHRTVHADSDTAAALEQAAGPRQVVLPQDRQTAPARRR